MVRRDRRPQQNSILGSENQVWINSRRCFALPSRSDETTVINHRSFASPSKHLINFTCAMDIIPVPMLQTNLGYLVKCKATGRAFFLDIAEGCTQVVMSLSVT